MIDHELRRIGRIFGATEDHRADMAKRTEPNPIPEHCGCGGELEHSWHPDGRVETGVHCRDCGYHWDPGWGISFAEGYQCWVTYMADLSDELLGEP
jgi:hypothetical protein